MCTDEYGKFDTIQLHVFIIHAFVYTGQLHSMVGTKSKCSQHSLHNYTVSLHPI